jgi:hypothetical protein
MRHRQRALDQAMTGRATIVIAHRLSTIKCVRPPMPLVRGEPYPTCTRFVRARTWARRAAP